MSSSTIPPTIAIGERLVWVKVDPASGEGRGTPLRWQWGRVCDSKRV